MCDMDVSRCRMAFLLVFAIWCASCRMVRKGGLGGAGGGGASVSRVYHWFSVLSSSCSFESATGMFCSSLYGICFGWGMVLGF